MDTVLTSYLVKLGWKVDQPGAEAFMDALDRVDKAVNSTAGGSAEKFLKMGVGLNALLFSMGAAAAHMANKFADADQEQRLWAMRMYMSQDAARGLKIAIDALGQPLENIAWDKELHERFDVLLADQKRMAAELGPDYEKQMRNMRDIRFEFTRLQVEAQYGGMMVVKNLMNAFGGGEELEKRLKGFNDWLQKNLPVLTQEIATDLKPVLVDVMEIGKELWKALQDAGTEFVRLTGSLTNNGELASGEGSLKNITKATGEWVKALADVIRMLDSLMLKFQEMWDNPLERTLLTTALGSRLGPYGAALGAIAGAGSYIYQVGSEMSREKREQLAPREHAARMSEVSQAATAAKQVSADTGIPWQIIFAQWVHETGDFTNRGARDLNNLAGIKIPGTDKYQGFNSLDEFARRYEEVLKESRYKGILESRTPEEFAAILKRGGYYGDTYEHYVAGIKSGMRTWFQTDGAGGNTTVNNIGDVTVNVVKPGATAEEIGAAVHSSLQSKIESSNQRNTAQSNGVYAY